MAAQVALLEPVEKPEETKNEHGFPKPTLQKAKPYSWGLRNSIQLIIFLVTIGIGIHFFIYFLQASGDGAITVSRPAGENQLCKRQNRTRGACETASS
jgi:hypothetical protein